MTKTFKSFTKDNKWRTMGKGMFADKKASGVPVAIFWESGSFKTIANVDALPDGIAAKGRAAV